MPTHVVDAVEYEICVEHNIDNTMCDRCVVILIPNTATAARIFPISILFIIMYY